MKALDNLGQEIKVGDVIAYATTIGRSANQSIYVVDDIVKAKSAYSWGSDDPTVLKLKATPICRSYGHYGKIRPATLSMLERCIVLPQSYKELIEKADNND